MHNQNRLKQILIKNKILSEKDYLEYLRKSQKEDLGLVNFLLAKKIIKGKKIYGIVDIILEYAILEGASDIHIEPEIEQARVRYRIGGVLYNLMVFPKHILPTIAGRIKVLSNLKLGEYRLPQNGRFKIQTPEYKISFRVSTIPVFNGEKMVIHLSNESNKILTLSHLGLEQNALKVIKENIDKSQGIILVTGPAGCGKMATLYAIINTLMLNKPGIKIATIEDPIEYKMPGIIQSQINPQIGYTFAAGLHSFLSQNLDVILVSEIRDKETANMVFDAAMAGHLILAGLNADDSDNALLYLNNMGIEPFLIASTLNIIITQRLVRKICENCKEIHKISQETEKELKNAFNLPDLKKALVNSDLIKTGKEPLSSIKFYHGKGCELCQGTGYKNQIGVYEVLEITEKIAELILKGAPIKEINNEAEKEGVITLVQDGFMKVKQGITTFEEILQTVK